MAPPWKIVGSHSFTPVAPLPEPLAYELSGNKFSIVVPLAWPMKRSVEEALGVINEKSAAMAFRELLPDEDDEPKFPASDDELVVTAPDGSPYPLPWVPPEGQEVPDDWNDTRPRPTSWVQLFNWWHRQNQRFSTRDMAVALGEAVEVMTGLPLEQSAPSLHTFITTPPTGLGASGSTDELTSTEN